MDIFNLGNIFNALRLSKKVEPAQAVKRENQVEQTTSSAADHAEDSVSISQEALVNSSIIRAAQESKQETTEIREDKVSEIKEKIEKGEYSVPADSVAEHLLQGPDIYQDLK